MWNILWAHASVLSRFKDSTIQWVCVQGYKHVSSRFLSALWSHLQVTGHRGWTLPSQLGAPWRPQEAAPGSSGLVQAKGFISVEHLCRGVPRDWVLHLSLPDAPPRAHRYCYVCCGSIFFSEEAQFVKPGKRWVGMIFTVLKHSEQISVGTDGPYVLGACEGRGWPQVTRKDVGFQFKCLTLRFCFSGGSAPKYRLL